MHLGHISHFGALMLFAALVSVATGSVIRRSAGGRIRYALLSFVWFVIASIGLAWLMYPFSR